MTAVVMREQDIRAQSELKKLGQPLSINPTKALLGLVGEAAGNVAWYRERVAALGDDITVADRIKTEEIKSVLRMYNEERDRLAKYSKLCIDVGIAERLIKIEERQADTMTAIIKAVIRKLGLGAEVELVAFTTVREEILKLAGREVIDMPIPPKPTPQRSKIRNTG